MSKNNRLISIVIATHKRPRLLVRALDCIAEQTYQPREVVIVDDGSGPEVQYAVEEWQERNRPSFKVQYQWQRNKGPAAARNRGVEASSGELIQFLDDDDLMCPDALQHLASALDGRLKAIAMASYQHWEGGNPTGAVVRPQVQGAQETLRAMIQGTWFVPIHGYLFTRAALEQIGSWNPVLTSQEDDEFLLRAAMAKIPLRAAPEARVFYCQHAGPRRATPGKPGEQLLQGLEKRMYADLAIRESVFEALNQQDNVEPYGIAFALWQMRLRKRYSAVLHKLSPQSELLEWLTELAEEDGDASDLPPPVASV
ncbi:glycosyltransferase family 2 protein [Alloalcanivorax xenomutans]|uniref:glycosyltransferase family 2 protein n=1 Tax=Alloalcanivorax xenomutans TaxID=1094342 RepID=UPI003A7FE81F